MNPWLQSSPGPGEPSYVEAYCHFLSRQVQALLSAEQSPSREPTA